MKRPLPIIGWREWVALPELGVSLIKAKVDTGARTSALHAFGLKTYSESGQEWARFSVHPFQDDSETRVAVVVPVLEYRRVKSSNGKTERRPVIVTNVDILGKRWPIELTLTRRDEMSFRMLLGRQAVRNHVLVDAGKSFLTSAAKKPLTTKKPPVTKKALATKKGKL